MITAFFRDREHVSSAVDELLEWHFDADQIRVVIATREGRRLVPVRYHTAVAGGAAVGGGIGAVVGGVGAALVAAGIIPFPDIGVLGSSPAIAALQGMVGGGGVGILMGLLGGLAWWREQPELRAEEIGEGRVMVGVLARGGHIDQVRRLFEQVGAERVTICDTRDTTCEQA